MRAPAHERALARTFDHGHRVRVGLQQHGPLHACVQRSLRAHAERLPPPPNLVTRRNSKEAWVAKTKIDTLSYTGRSGRAYDFRIYVWETRFKSLPGVYVVASRSMEPGKEPQYSPLFIAP